MALVNWSPALETGVQTIDEQHRLLADLINQLDDAVDAGMDNQRVVNLMLFLQTSAQAHFLKEEALMTQCHYPGAKAHKELHRVLMQQLAHLIQPIEEDAGDISKATVKACRDWFLTHLNGDDRRLAEFVLRP